MNNLNIIKHSLVYQKNSMEILHTYLKSTFNHLQVGNLVKVERLEKGIMNIVNNAFEDRIEANRLLKGKTINEAIMELQGPDNEGLKQLSDELDRLEDKCRKQAQLNKELALRLEEENMKRLEEAFHVVQETGVLDLALANVAPVNGYGEERVQ